MLSPSKEQLPVILTIDDEAVIRTSFKGFLEDYDYTVLEADNGITGLEIFEKQQPGLVLIDLNMPIMDGLQVLERIQEISPDTPTIVISGTGELSDIASALRLGAWDYLFKPIQDLSVLLHSIDTVLERARLIKERKEYQLQLETTVQQRTAELQKSKERYRSLITNIPVGIFRYSTGVKGRYITANPAMASIFGYASVEALMATHPNDIFISNDDHRLFHEELYQQGKVIALELLMKQRNGVETWTAITAHLTKDSEDDIEYVDTLIEDISKRKEAEDRIRHLAYYDDLTNLANRSLFLFHLTRTLATLQRRGLYGGVILIDLDRFKIINDSLGFSTGDKLIQAVAKRLQGMVRNEDTLARIGGDEFAILFSEIGDNQESAGRILGDIAEKISTKMSKAFIIDNQKLYTSVTIGIDLFPSNIDSAEDILKHASAAVNSCKKKDRGTYMFFMPDMQAAAKERLLIEKELRSALVNNELELFYQPQVNPSGLIVGAEALIRWIHPQRGMIMPNQFITISETNGLIGPIGNWVMREACRQLAAWEKLGLTNNLQHISINVSPWQFRQEDFTDIVHSTVLDTGVEPKKLTIEITEGIAIGNLKDTIKKI